MASAPAGVAIPDHATVVRVAVEQECRVALVDVAHEPVVDAVSHQLAEPRREAAGDLARDAGLLVLLLPDPAGAVVHGDADTALSGAIGAAAMPQAAVPDEHAAAWHLGGDAVVALAEDRRLAQVRPRDDPRGAVGLGEVGGRPPRGADRGGVRVRGRQGAGRG